MTNYPKPKNCYEARWNHARKLAEKYNEYFAKGYLALLDGEQVDGPFIILDAEIILKLGENCTQQMFNYDPQYDDGYYTTIPEITERFAMLKFYEPIPIAMQ